MWKKYYSNLFITLLVIAGCKKAKPEYSVWIKNHKINASDSSFYAKQYESVALPIDTIYRSMQGPYEIKHISLDEKQPVVWISGYSVKLIDANSKSVISPEFMCHNNLNYYQEDLIPWKIKTSGANDRIFTLSEGQTDLSFPEGFGIPVLGKQKFEMVSQVLNHNYDTIDVSIQHVAQLEISRVPLIPLYQQSVFVTKQISGSKGDYGTSLLCIPYHLDSSRLDGQQPNHTCEVDYSESNYDPYQDKYGRKYTGHWKIPYGEETLTTDVTQMLDLQEDTRIHMISVHLHPFGEKLELWDKTENKLLYSAHVEPKDSLLGFKKINFYSNKEGIPVFKDHQYILSSTYNCTDSIEEHTAMAVMYLYLRDQ